MVRRFFAVAVFLAASGSNATWADAVDCEDIGTYWQCTGSGSADFLIVGRRTNPDRIAICSFYDGIETVLWNSSTLQDNVNVYGTGGNDVLWVLGGLGSSTTGCGHTYYEVNYGNYYVDVHGGEGADDVIQGRYNSQGYGDSGNDFIRHYSNLYPTFGGTGNDIMGSHYIYAGEDLYGDAGCDCMEDYGGPSGPRADFYCGTGAVDSDTYFAKDQGVVNDCEFEEEECVDSGGCCYDLLAYNCPPV